MSALHRLDLPPVWTAGAVAAGWLLAQAAPAWRLDLGVWPGGSLVVIGLALVVWSAIRFARSRTPIEPRKKPRSLITGGPYRINRNPIYTGMLLILIGWALWLGAPLALIPAAAFPVIITRRFILGEEAALRAAFGAEAEAWLARSRRW